MSCLEEETLLFKPYERKALWKMILLSQSKRLIKVRRCLFGSGKITPRSKKKQFGDYSMYEETLGEYW